MIVTNLITESGQYSDPSGSDVVSIVLAIISLIATWIIFEKAGVRGWGVLIPIYNVYLVVKVSGNSGWWVWLLLVPLLNIAIAFWIALGLAKAFGRSGLFGFFLLFLLTPLGLCILAFGSSRYQGPALY